LYGLSHGSTKPQKYAIQHIPVPVPSQDKLAGLRHEGHPEWKWGDWWRWIAD